MGDLFELPTARHAWASERKIAAAWSRFMGKVEACDPLGCWLWRGGRSRGAGKHDNYGSFWIGGTGVRAHIFAWIASGGDLTDRLTIDHVCRNTLCVNPLHMEPVTIAENNRRAWTARRIWRCAA